MVEMRYGYWEQLDEATVTIRLDPQNDSDSKKEGEDKVEGEYEVENVEMNYVPLSEGTLSIWNFPCPY